MQTTATGSQVADPGTAELQQHTAEPEDDTYTVEMETAGSSPPTRPHTRLSSGIRKEKVRYSFFASSGKPQNLDEAVNDKNWKEAVDLECQALIKK